MTAHAADVISAIADTSSDFDRGRAAATVVAKMSVMVNGWRKRIEEAVARDGRALRDISMAAGLSHGYLHGILRDGKEPTLERFTRICAELNVSLSWALMGTEVSASSERLLRLIEADPAARDALVALLDRGAPR